MTRILLILYPAALLIAQENAVYSDSAAKFRISHAGWSVYEQTGTADNATVRQKVRQFGKGIIFDPNRRLGLEKALEEHQYVNFEVFVSNQTKAISPQDFLKAILKPAKKVKIIHEPAALSASQLETATAEAGAEAITTDTELPNMTLTIRRLLVKEKRHYLLQCTFDYLRSPYPLSRADWKILVEGFNNNLEESTNKARQLCSVWDTIKLM